MRLPSRPSRGQASEAVPGRLDRGDGLFAVDQAGRGKGRAIHLQLAHDDAQHLLQHFVFVDGGVDLARGLKQRLQARHLLLQVDCFATAGKLNSSRHRALRGISL